MNRSMASAPSPSPSPTPSPPSPSSAPSQAAILGIGIIAAVFFIGTILACACHWSKRKLSNPSDTTMTAATPIDIIPRPMAGSPSQRGRGQFTYEQLEVATDGFSMSNKLGEGSFGCVYRGVMVSQHGDRLNVAVKQLRAVGAAKGEEEFEAGVENMSRVHHRHLVSLIGYCISRSERLLVYDYVPNGTLEYHLHNRKDGAVLDWPTRLKIACGAARGLAYLHEDCNPRIIHRNIKSSNILLGHNFEARVSDFGLVKIASDMYTHVSTRVMGTSGYLAPEYATSGKLTEKSDVFSFGVVLLELVTGRKPVDASQPLDQEISLVEWARPIIARMNSEAYLETVADPALNGAYDPKEMLRMVDAATACVRYQASMRPKMSQVARLLESQISFSNINQGLSSTIHMTNYGKTSYNIDIMKHMMLAL